MYCKRREHIRMNCADGTMGQLKDATTKHRAEEEEKKEEKEKKELRQESQRRWWRRKRGRLGKNPIMKWKVREA